MSSQGRASGEVASGMASLRSHVYALVLRNWHRTAFTSAAGLHRWIRWARQRQNYRPPAELADRVSISADNIDGFTVYDVRPRQVTSRLRLLYLHGGAFVFEITRYHWDLIAELAERIGAVVTVPIYPLAPEHGFDAIFGMAMATYRDLLARARASDIVFVGDSAGGNMALVTTMLVAEQGLPTPAAHVLISPGVDVSLTNPDIYEYAKVDPWLAIPGGLEAIDLYAPGFKRTDWRISPTFGDLSVLPPTLLLTGTRDLLHPDAVLFAAKAREAGVDVELVVEKGMMHVWPLLVTREARHARNRIMTFLRKVEHGHATSNAVRSETAGSGEPTAPDALEARGGWPFAGAFTSIMSRFGAW
jgi:acetyl esterase/lipase